MEIRAVDDVMIHDVGDEMLAALAAEDFEAFAVHGTDVRGAER